MRIKVTVLADGHGPSEKLIGVKSKSGEIEQVIISKRILQNDAIEVGLALSEDEENFLIELPRESMRGRWRLWIPKSEMANSSLQAAE